MADELFNVYQYFEDGSQEKVLDRVPAVQAMTCVKGLITSIGAKLGTTQRVIVTDWGDCCNFEWKYGEGIVYPTREMLNGNSS